MLTTTVVGSFPQPRWLVDHEKFKKNLVPRVRLREIWRIPEPYLEEAQDDAVRLAVRDMERAGIDVVSDGEIRRESYFNQFANALSGIDLDRPGSAIARMGRPTPVPRVIGPIGRTRPVNVRDATFLRGITDRKIKATMPGPFTMTQLAQNEHYPDDESLAMAYAAAVNAELSDLEPIVDVLQLDEPYLQAQPDKARAYAIPVINTALAGLTKPIVIHLCFGYAAAYTNSGRQKDATGYSFLPELDRTMATHISIEAAQPRLDLSILTTLPSKTIVLGVLDLGDPTPETPDVVAARIRDALKHVPAERLVVAPDCGMKYLPRDVAVAKLRAMVDGARRVGA
jgi:5-methyltetrahydropteroyltriglutamate--homocysteine methyltransferase